MTTFKIFAGTDIGLRDNNEDNFTVCLNLETNQWIVPSDHQQIFELSEKGSLMVVADGMGGQNAGEVASAIAIETVQQLFSNEVTEDILSKPEKIKNFLKKVIVEADLRIKATAKENPSTQGMGSTLVMAWVIKQKVYVSWIGDSRAYSFVPNKGIARLSKDHSYVQKLVDAHKLTDDEAMVHPDSNIITRSLGDVSQTAHPDVADFSVEKGEIILLCSDGLCGVCKDELIDSILQEEFMDLRVAKEKLIEAALSNGGSDNITVALLQVVNVEQNLLKDKGTEFIGKKHLDFGSYKKYLLPLSVLLNIILLLLFIFRNPANINVQSGDSIDSLKEKSIENKAITPNPKVVKTVNAVKESECKKNKVVVDKVVNNTQDVNEELSLETLGEESDDSIADSSLTESSDDGQEISIPYKQ